MELRSGKTLSLCSKRRRTKTTSDETLVSCAKRRRTSALDNWSSIPGEILGLIAGKIASFDDYVRFSAVCRSWHMHATDHYQHFKHKFNGPLYMPAPTPGSKCITLLNPASGATLVRHLPEIAGSRCWGSPFGWLVTYDQTNLRLGLINPVTGASIPLPPLPKSTGYRETIKAFLTANPESDPDNCLVLIVNSKSRKLAFVRPASHSKVWSHIKDRLHLVDLTYSNGNLYGLEFSYGRRPISVYLFELNHAQNGRLDPRFVRHQTIDLTPFEVWDPFIRYENYLVDFKGNLCICMRHYSGYWDMNESSTDFKLFEIDLSNGNPTQITSLGDHCLFMGNNYSFSCKAAFPRANLFEQSHHEPRGFVSNYVFYTYNCDGHGESHKPHENRGFDVEVWDMSRSTKVCSRTESPNTLYEPLCILPNPTLKLRS